MASYTPRNAGSIDWKGRATVTLSGKVVVDNTSLTTTPPPPSSTLLPPVCTEYFLCIRSPPLKLSE